MDLDQKFQQRWEYRRKDDEVDSSTDDSKSSLGDEPVQKKHKLYVPSLSLSQDDDAIETPSSRENYQEDATKSVPFRAAEVTKKHCEPGMEKTAVDFKSKRNSGKRRNTKVRNHIQDREPVLLNDLKIFSESLLKDLKVAREKMFVQMKKQMTKLVAVKQVSRPRSNSCLKKSDGAMHQAGKKSCKRIQSSDGRLRKGSKKDNLGFESSKSSIANSERTNLEKAALHSNWMDKRETLSLPRNNSVHLVEESDQIGSSSYVTLPSVLPKPQTESLSIDSSLRNHNESGSPVNIAQNAEKENPVTDANNYGYLFGIQPDEQFGSLAQITSKGMGLLDYQNSQTSIMVSGLPVPLNHWQNNGFTITSQSAKDPAQQNNAARMDGGAIRVPGRSHALSECFVGNTISCSMHYDTNNADGGLASFRCGEVKRGHLVLK